MISLGNEGNEVDVSDTSQMPDAYSEGLVVKHTMKQMKLLTVASFSDADFVSNAAVP